MRAAGALLAVDRAGASPASRRRSRCAHRACAVPAVLLWIVVIALAGRFTVRPLARLASRAQLQRDLVVAATEAERARVAADIHDDALQELTLLVRRLDAAGDTEGADIARTVSDRLRAICGDLRLPILDDLGVGPALDWLVLRIERLAGGEVRLERADGTRPPPDVELAFFRVAQEALANAVKHGRPPIVVRYRSVDGAASLSIDDAGAGITPDAGDRAEREGHFGLLNMQQRAEGIGAILDVRRWPTGRHPRPARVARPVTDARRAGRRSGSPIVDDHPVVRDGTAALLGAQPGIVIAGTAGSLDEARALLATTDADVLLLDIRLGTQSGLNLLTDGRGRRAGGPRSPPPRDHRRSPPTTIPSTPRRRSGSARQASCSRPRRWPSSSTRSAARPAAAWRSASGRGRPTGPPLPPRAGGRGAGRRGAEQRRGRRGAGIGAKTVETHLARLFERFSIASRTELATRALREGWLDLPPD